MLRIGLTGGIASGKSVASRRFEQLGARVCDHDVLSRQAVEPGSAALSELVRRFGDKIVRGNELDRPALAQVAFSDPVALADLNAIVHPYVFSLSQAADRRARQDGVEVMVHAIPLLVETDQGKGEFDLVLAVEAPIEVRLRRLMDARGMSREEALARIEAQASDEQRAAIADVILDGSGSDLNLYKQVDRFWHDHIPMSDRSRTLEL
jgi:dephospho-CoA kinase